MAAIEAKTELKTAQRDDIKFGNLSGFFEKPLSEDPEDKNLLPDITNIKKIFNQIPIEGNDRISVYVPIYENYIYLNIDIGPGYVVINQTYDFDLSETRNKHDDAFMVVHGSLENDWYNLKIIIDNNDPLTKIIIDWFRNFDIDTIGVVTEINRPRRYTAYFDHLLLLLRNLSSQDSGLSSCIPLFEHVYEKNDWDLQPVEGIEDNNGIKCYLYHNHVVDNVYRLDVREHNYDSHLRYHLSFNNKIDKNDPMHPVAILAKDTLLDKTFYDSIQDYVENNELTRELFNILSKSPITHKHRCVIATLYMIWS